MAKLIGQNYTTPDLVAKVTGKAKYAEDFRADGMLFAKLLLSPMPHARVVRIDTSAAMAVPGVKAILTADDLPAPADIVTDLGQTIKANPKGERALTNEPIYEGEPIEKALKWLMNHIPGKTSAPSGYFFYGQYYAVQAMWHAGGDYWAKWFPAIRDLLLSRQAGDGSWPDNEVCPEFGTAMAAIILQMPNNFLPIFSP